MEAKHNNADYLDDNPLVFYSNPGQLQELACVATIPFLWYHQIKTNHSLIMPENLIDVDCSDLDQLPSVLQHMIKERISVVETSFKEWLDFHRRNVFFDRKKAAAAAILDFMNFISWHADGTISFEQTAKKLIKSDLLSDTEKYRIACIYSFVDDVRKLWPIRTTTILNHPMVRYWNSRISGKPCKIPVDRRCSCIEASLLKNEDAETRSAFEYLWGFLTDDERVPIVVLMCNKNNQFDFSHALFLKDALCKFNKRQLEHAVISSAESIFNSMLRYSTDVVIQFWNRVKNMVTNDQFYKIICGVLRQNRRIDYPGSEEYNLTLSFEMWISAPNALKNHILNNHFRFEKILEKLCRFGDKYRYYKYDRQTVQDVRFLMELLSSTSQANKDTFWKRYWSEILHIMSPKCAQQIMELCLQSDEEIASFKTSHLESFCFEMVKDGNFSDLSEFIQSCSDDPVVVFNHRVSVLKSDELLYHLIGYGRVLTLPELHSFETFLRETFPDTDELNEFKRNFIFGEESMTYFRNLIQNYNLNLKNLGLFADHVMSSMPELSLAKIRFLELSRDILISGKLTYERKDDWINFTKWCLDDDDAAVENFKLSLPVEQIFNAFLKKCTASVKRLSFWQNPFKMMKLLEWVFPTQEASQNFKLGKLGAYEDIPLIRSVFKSNDENLIDKVLMWFFNEDEKQVKKFKVSLKRVKVPKMKPRPEMKSSNVSSYRLRPRTRQHRSQEDISEASSSRAKLRKRKKRYQTNSEVSSYRAKLRKRITASK